MANIVLGCAAVLFDMDGTLVDSRELVERMWLRWAARRHVSPEAILAVAHGRRTLETMQLVAPEFATPEEAARLDEEEEEEARLHGGETAILGAASLLSRLPPERWAVVTSAVRDIALRRIAAVGLPAPTSMLESPTPRVTGARPRVWDFVLPTVLWSRTRPRASKRGGGRAPRWSAC
jgi:mannitol-1-/sugar-/sorbitol-6-phosphatase